MKAPTIAFIAVPAPLLGAGGAGAGEPPPSGEDGEPAVPTGDLVAALEASLAVDKAESKPASTKARMPPARKRSQQNTKPSKGKGVRR